MKRIFLEATVYSHNPKGCSTDAFVRQLDHFLVNLLDGKKCKASLHISNVGIANCWCWKMEITIMIQKHILT